MQPQSIESALSTATQTIDDAAHDSGAFCDAVLDAFQRFDNATQRQEIAAAAQRAIEAKPEVLRWMSNLRLAQLGAALQGHGATEAEQAVATERVRLRAALNEGYRLLGKGPLTTFTYEQLQHFRDATERFISHPEDLVEIDSVMRAMQTG